MKTGIPEAMERLSVSLFCGAFVVLEFFFCIILSFKSLDWMHYDRYKNFPIVHFVVFIEPFLAICTKNCNYRGVQIFPL